MKKPLIYIHFLSPQHCTRNHLSISLPCSPPAIHAPPSSPRCHVFLLTHNSNRFVAKMNKKVVARELFFEDVKMQMVARKWAAKYNDFNPPKRIEFLMSYVVELADRVPEVVTCGLEPYPAGAQIQQSLAPNIILTILPIVNFFLFNFERYVEGVYRKFNNNSGYVSHDERNTPQAFSHYTYEHSNRQLLLVDIQVCFASPSIFILPSNKMYREWEIVSAPTSTPIHRFIPTTAQALGRATLARGASRSSSTLTSAMPSASTSASTQSTPRA